MKSKIWSFLLIAIFSFAFSNVSMAATSSSPPDKVEKSKIIKVEKQIQIADQISVIPVVDFVYHPTIVNLDRSESINNYKQLSMSIPNEISIKSSKNLKRSEHYTNISTLYKSPSLQNCNFKVRKIPAA